MGKMLSLASTGHLAAAASTGGAGNYTFLIVIVVLFGLFYFVMIRPQRNRQRKVQQMQSEVGPGARVRTTAGMYATVAEIDGDDVLLEVAPGVNVRFMRRAIMDVVQDDAGLNGMDGSAAAEADGEAGPAADGSAPAAETADAGQAARPGAGDGTSAS